MGVGGLNSDIVNPSAIPSRSKPKLNIQLSNRRKSLNKRESSEPRSQRKMQLSINRVVPSLAAIIATAGDVTSERGSNVSPSTIRA